MNRTLLIINDPFQFIQTATDTHRASHNCWAYPFQDGPSLGVLSAAIQAKRILELGTALGYTACWLAYGSPQSHVDTIERDLSHIKLAREHFAKVNLQERITVHPGDFEAVLPNLDATYDIVFFDGYAPSLAILQRIKTMLRTGGMLICSNLQLDSHESQPCIDLLSNQEHWQTAMLAESGKTGVSIKK